MGVPDLLKGGLSAPALSNSCYLQVPPLSLQKGEGKRDSPPPAESDALPFLLGAAILVGVATTPHPISV